MAIELKVPTVGESVSEVQIGTWLKDSGDYVEKDEPVVEIESDKATVEVSAPAAGTISEILKKAGEDAKPGDVIGYLEEGEKQSSDKKDKETSDDEEDGEEKSKKKKDKETKEEEPDESTDDDGNGKADESEKSSKSKEDKEAAEGDGKDAVKVMPAAARLLAEHDLEAEDVDATGKGNRLLKEDVLRHLEEQESKKKSKTKEAPSADGVKASGDREEETVPMSPMRKRIAEHLVSAQQTAALLTTFNEIDMSEVAALRQSYKDRYEKDHGVKLGFMSFFVKAVIEALKAYPQVNAEVRGTDIIYKNYYDIGIAVGGGKGLVVPVLRNAERMSFAEIEKAVGDFGRRASQNKISIEELQGGTFTISNGGIYGSLLSTPIVNPPQSGILGMHAIEERPVVRNGEIVIRPMMYVALTYDHRIVDGREAVGFLMRIKECIEDPSRILLEI